MIVKMLLQNQPPIVQALMGPIMAMIPNDAMESLDRAFVAVARDVANNRDAEAASKLRDIFSALGVDLSVYRD